MKVVHVCLNRKGGAAAAAWRLHMALLQAGVNSWFFTLEPRGESDAAKQWVCWQEQKKTLFQRINDRLSREVGKWIFRRVYRECKELSASYESIKPLLNCEISSLPFSEKNILDQPVFQDADVIHLHWVTLLLHYADFFRRCKNRFGLVWTFHDLNPILGIFNYGFDISANPIAASLEQGVAIFKKKCLGQYGSAIDAIAPSQWMAEKIKESSFAEIFRVKEIPYCFEADSAEIPGQADARRILGFPEHAVIFLSLVENNQSGRKNASEIPVLAWHFPQFLFVMAGHNSQAETEPCPNLIKTGYISDKGMLRNYYAACNAVIITSVEDNLPNVMLEAFVYGRPVISYPAGGMRQYVIGGLTGLKAKDMQAESLYEPVNEFVSSMHVYDAAASIKAFAREHFNNKAIIAGHLNLYNRLLN